MAHFRFQTLMPQYNVFTKISFDYKILLKVIPLPMWQQHKVTEHINPASPISIRPTARKWSNTDTAQTLTQAGRGVKRGSWW